MRTSEVLSAAARKVAAGWCRGSNATDAEGRVAFPHGPEARNFCPLGAVTAVLTERGWERDAAFNEGFRRARSHMDVGMRLVSVWNDDPAREQGEVVAMLEDASRRALATGD